MINLTLDWSRWNQAPTPATLAWLRMWAIKRILDRSVANKVKPWTRLGTLSYSWTPAVTFQVVEEKA